MKEEGSERDLSCDSIAIMAMVACVQPGSERVGRTGIAFNQAFPRRI
jgi:hypothetical protein